MAARINGVTDYFTFSPPVTGEPFTMSCWIYATALANTFVIPMANGGNYHALLCLTGTVVARSFVVGDGSFDGQSTTTGFTANTWHHICGVWGSTSNRQVFLNGASGAANTTTKSVGTLSSASVAAAAGHVRYMADMSIWNVALTQPEISSLAKGFSGSRIRPASLLFHAPLIRERKEIRTGAPLTDVGTPTVEAHAPIIGAIVV